MANYWTERYNNLPNYIVVGQEKANLRREQSKLRKSKKRNNEKK